MEDLITGISNASYKVTQQKLSLASEHINNVFNSLIDKTKYILLLTSHPPLFHSPPAFRLTTH